jgi:hypothetical protein
LIDEKRSGLWSQVFEQEQKEGGVLYDITNKAASTFSALKKQKDNFCGMRTINPEFQSRKQDNNTISSVTGCRKRTN